MKKKAPATTPDNLYRAGPTDLDALHVALVASDLGGKPNPSA